MIPKHGPVICMLAFLASWIPFLGNLANPVAEPLSDNRKVAGFPSKPRGLLEWLLLPRNLESYMEDNFGFREEMVETYSTMRFVLRSPVIQSVAFGENGWLYYTGNQAFEQSLGQIMRQERLVAFANLTAELDRLISDAGGRLLVAIPPNQHTIYFENLPAWARGFTGSSEYDAIMKMLAERGVRAIDLRPVLLAGKSLGTTYRPRDTHWSSLGALLAFNEIAQALGNDSWVIDPKKVYRGTREEIGDLSRMAGVPEIFMDTEAQVELDRPWPAVMNLQSFEDDPMLPSYLVTTSSSGEPITIIGDSFTRIPLRDYFAVYSARLFWTHFKWCEFDWTLIASKLPSTVLLMPTERSVGCDLPKKPKNLSSADSLKLTSRG